MGQGSNSVKCEVCLGSGIIQAQLYSNPTPCYECYGTGGITVYFDTGSGNSTAIAPQGNNFITSQRDEENTAQPSA